MATYRVHPSKQVAIMGAVVGAAILVSGFVMIGTGGKNGWFMWLWLTIGIAVIAINLWAAFARNGSLQTISTEGSEPPHRFGMDVSRR